MTRRLALILSTILIIPVLCVSTWADDPIEEALAEVRDVKADMFSRHSSVLGELPGPAEFAAAQMRIRPIPRPESGGPNDFKFSDQERELFLEQYQGVELSTYGNTGRCGSKTLPLGVTGAHITEFLNHTELFVLGIEQGSPADGILERFDIIIGANGRLFEDPEDPRPEMGYALLESQSPEMQGILSLQIVRDGIPMNLQLDLGDAESYSPTWPAGCDKSDRVRTAALRCVLDSDLSNRYTANWSWAPLFMMASGEDEALEQARRILYRNTKLSEDYPDEAGGMNSWIAGYRLINLCEYYLLTGDSAVLPEIQYVTRIAEDQQYPTGGWTHGYPGGYGQINCCGLANFIGLILARECGVETDPNELAIAIRYFGKWCGTNLPYGEGAPGAHSGRMDNGMNSMSALAFHLLGEEEMAERWARSVCYMWMGRDKGHAEGIFSMAWGPLGAALAPPEEFQMFLDRMQWYYEMARTPDDGYVYMRGSRQPYPSGHTAAMALFFYLPEQRLRLLGAPQSVFGTRPPEPLKDAAQHYKDKDWTSLVQTLDAHLARPNLDPEHREYAESLHAAFEELKRHVSATLTMIQENIALEKRLTAQSQLDALNSLLGRDILAAAVLRSELGDGPFTDPVQSQPEYGTFNPDWLQDAGIDRRGGIRDGFAHSPEYIERTNESAFEGMTSDEIAPYLSHFNSGPYGGAVAAMVAQGEAAEPLMLELMADENPWLRGASVQVLAEIHKFDGDPNAPREMSPRLSAAITQLGPLVEDPHPAVQAALGSFVDQVHLETEETCRIVVKMASNEDAGVRYKAANMARLWLEDPETVIQTGMLVSQATSGNTPRHWQFAHMAIARHKEDPRCRPAIPIMAAFIRNTGNTIPIRGFFSDSAQHVPLQVMKAQWDVETQRMENVVPALCCCYVRTSTPSIKNYKGWHELRLTAQELLESLDPSLAPELRAAILEQEEWLSDVDEALLTLTLQLDPEEARATANERLDYLRDLADKLEP